MADERPLSRDAWIARYGGQALLDAEGFDVVPCVDCADSVCHGWRVLPARPGVCPECAVDHTPEEPHNRDSLTYQYQFFAQSGRWPTWSDALAHCAEPMRATWTKALTERGIKIDA